MKIDKSDQEIIVNRYLSGDSAPQLANEYGVAFNSIYQILKKHNISRRSPTDNMRKYKINDGFLDIIDNESKAYFLGLFYADGCLMKHRMVINLISEDAEILQTLCDHIFIDDRPLIKIVGGFRPTPNNRISWCKPISRLDISCVRMANRLRDFGVSERKTDTIRLPIGIIPDNLFHHFVRGYFDGDGCVKWQRWSIISNPNFVLDMKERLQQILCSPFYIQKCQHSTKIHTLECYSLPTMEKLFTYLYGDSTIYLKRKKLKYIESLKLMREGPTKGRLKSLKYHAKMSIPVVQKDLNDNIIKIWSSNRECGRAGFDRNEINKCCKGERVSYREYRWEKGVNTP